MLSHASPLLAPDLDPEPVEHIVARDDIAVLLVCEHAGQAVPRALDGLGLEKGAIDLHVGWDIGAAAVTRAMARELGCAAILQRYSRLVIDCNRPTSAPDAIPQVSDGVPVPGNTGLTAADREQRIDEVLTPFHDAVTAARSGRRVLLLSIHSFTPEMRTRPGPRPWHIGFLCRNDTATSQVLMDTVAAERPDMKLALNEPYQIDDESDWFVPVHGEGSGLPHSLVEIRNDLVRTPEAQAEMAALLCKAVRSVLESQC